MSLTRVRLRGGSPVVRGDLVCVTPGSVIDEGRVADGLVVLNR